MLLGNLVLRGVGLFVETEAVLEAAAATARDADAQHGRLRHLLLAQNALDFFGSLFSNGD